MAEFVAGTAKILQLSEITGSERSGRLRHLEVTMSLARFYNWSAIRTMYASVLEDIQYGVLSWQDDMKTYQQAILSPLELVKTDVRTSGSVPDKKATKQDSGICRKFNWETCSRSQCPFSHKCFSCFKYHGESASHSAKDCGKRMEYLATRQTQPGAQV